MVVVTRLVNLSRTFDNRPGRFSSLGGAVSLLVHACAPSHVSVFDDTHCLYRQRRATVDNDHGECRMPRGLVVIGEFLLILSLHSAFQVSLEFRALNALFNTSCRGLSDRRVVHR